MHIYQLDIKSRFSENPLSFDFTLLIKNKGVKYPITSILIWGTVSAAPV